MNDLNAARFSGTPQVLQRGVATHETRATVSKVDWALGFVMPLGIFLEAGSKIFLATSPLGEEQFAIPLSLLFLPVALALTAFRWEGAVAYSRPVAFLSTAFVLYCVVMSAVANLTHDSTAILYGVQWILVFLWMPYFLTLTDVRRRSGFLNGFIIGTAFTIAYYLTSAAVEFVSYGALLDQGRMSQNLILPGQYQIAVYVPTTMAYSVSIVNALHLSGQKRLPLQALLALNAGALLCLIGFAAREGILVYFLATVLLISFRDARRAALSLLATFVAAGIFVASINTLTDFALQSDVRALQKIASVPENRTAGRDIMIAEVVTVIEREPMYGTRFLPPNTEGFGLTINAPSAHNMYVDAFAWTGLVGGLLFLAFALVLFGSSTSAILSSFMAGSAGGIAPRYAGLLLIILLLVSNNINVPMRQPLIAPVIAFLIFLVELRKMPIFSAKRS